jgi:hypothetical protein
MRYVRFALYLVIAFLMILVPGTPLPFRKPEWLHDFFGAESGGILFFFLFCLLGLLTLVILTWFLVVSIRHRKVDRPLLLETLAIPIIVLATFEIGNLIRGQTEPAENIVRLNEGWQTEDFVNPFLGYKMLDCRDITDEFDVIFIPRHLPIETEYLAYAPRRTKKTIDYFHGRKYGEDWYWEFSGSQWSDGLKTCVWQNKSPHV